MSQDPKLDPSEPPAGEKKKASPVGEFGWVRVPDVRKEEWFEDPVTTQELGQLDWTKHLKDYDKAPQIDPATGLTTGKFFIRKAGQHEAQRAYEEEPRDQGAQFIAETFREKERELGYSPIVSTEEYVQHEVHGVPRGTIEGRSRAVPLTHPTLRWISEYGGEAGAKVVDKVSWGGWNSVPKEDLDALIETARKVKESPISSEDQPYEHPLDSMVGYGTVLKDEPGVSSAVAQARALAAKSEYEENLEELIDDRNAGRLYSGPLLDPTPPEALRTWKTNTEAIRDGGGEWGVVAAKAAENHAINELAIADAQDLFSSVLSKPAQDVAVPMNYGVIDGTAYYQALHAAHINAIIEEQYPDKGTLYDFTSETVLMGETGTLRRRKNEDERASDLATAAEIKSEADKLAQRDILRAKHAGRGLFWIDTDQTVQEDLTHLHGVLGGLPEIMGVTSSKEFIREADEYIENEYFREFLGYQLENLETSLRMPQILTGGWTAFKPTTVTVTTPTAQEFQGEGALDRFGKLFPTTTMAAGVSTYATAQDPTLRAEYNLSVPEEDRLGFTPRRWEDLPSGEQRPKQIPYIDASLDAFKTFAGQTDNPAMTKHLIQGYQEGKMLADVYRELFQHYGHEMEMSHDTIRSLGRTATLLGVSTEFAWGFGADPVTFLLGAVGKGMKSARKWRDLNSSVPKHWRLLAEDPNMTADMAYLKMKQESGDYGATGAEWFKVSTGIATGLRNDPFVHIAKENAAAEKLAKEVAEEADALGIKLSPFALPGHHATSNKWKHQFISDRTEFHMRPRKGIDHEVERIDEAGKIHYIDRAVDEGGLSRKEAREAAAKDYKDLIDSYAARIERETSIGDIYEKGGAQYIRTEEGWMVARASDIEDAAILGWLKSKHGISLELARNIRDTNRRQAYERVLHELMGASGVGVWEMPTKTSRGLPAERLTELRKSLDETGRFVLTPEERFLMREAVNKGHKESGSWMGDAVRYGDQAQKMESELKEIRSLISRFREGPHSRRAAKERLQEMGVWKYIAEGDLKMLQSGPHLGRVTEGLVDSTELFGAFRQSTPRAAEEIVVGPEAMKEGVLGRRLKELRLKELEAERARWAATEMKLKAAEKELKSFKEGEGAIALEHQRLMTQRNQAQKLVEKLDEELKTWDDKWVQERIAFTHAHHQITAIKNRIRAINEQIQDAQSAVKGADPVPVHLKRELKQANTELYKARKEVKKTQKDLAKYAETRAKIEAKRLETAIKVSETERRLNGSFAGEKLTPAWERGIEAILDPSVRREGERLVGTIDRGGLIEAGSRRRPAPRGKSVRSVWIEKDVGLTSVISPEDLRGIAQTLEFLERNAAKLRKRASDQRAAIHRMAKDVAPYWSDTWARRQSGVIDKTLKSLDNRDSDKIWRGVLQDMADKFERGMGAIHRMPKDSKHFVDILDSSTVRISKEYLATSWGNSPKNQRLASDTLKDGEIEIDPLKFWAFLKQKYGQDPVKEVVKTYVDKMGTQHGTVSGAPGDILLSVLNAARRKEKSLILSGKQVTELQNVKPYLDKAKQEIGPDRDAANFIHSLRQAEKDISLKTTGGQKGLAGGLNAGIMQFLRQLGQMADPIAVEIGVTSEKVAQVLKGAHHLQDAFNEDMSMISRALESTTAGMSPARRENAYWDAVSAFLEGRTIEAWEEAATKLRHFPLRAHGPKSGGMWTEAVHHIRNDPRIKPMRAQLAQIEGEIAQRNAAAKSIGKEIDDLKAKQKEFEARIEARGKGWKTLDKKLNKLKAEISSKKVDYEEAIRKAELDKDIESQIINTLSRGNPLVALSRAFFPRGAEGSGKEAMILYNQAFDLIDRKDISFREFAREMRRVTERNWPRDSDRYKALAFSALAVSQAAILNRANEMMIRAVRGFLDPEDMKNIDLMWSSEFAEVVSPAYIKDAKGKRILNPDRASVDEAVLKTSQAMDGISKTLNKFEIPFTQKEVRGPATAGAVRRTKPQSVKLIETGMDDRGRKYFMPQVMMDKLDEMQAPITKELSARFARARTPQEVLGYGRELDFARLWRTSIITGLILPRGKYWYNNFIGDFSQIWFEMGAGQAGRSSFQLLTGTPWSPMLHNIQRTMQKKAGNVPVLGSIVNAMFNPHANKIYRGEAGYILLPNGRKMSYDHIRRVKLEEGIDDVMATEEFLQVAYRAVEGGGNRFTNALNRVMHSPSSVWRTQRQNINWFASYVQQRQRGNLFMDLLRQGYSEKEAARLTKDALYDWKHGLAKWETEMFMGRWMPFYRFYRLAMQQAFSAVAQPLMKPSQAFVDSAFGSGKFKRIHQQHVFANQIQHMIDPGIGGNYETRQQQLDELAPFFRASWMKHLPHLGSRRIEPGTDEYQMYLSQRGYAMTHNNYAMPPMTLLDMAGFYSAFAAGLSAVLLKTFGKGHLLAPDWEERVYEPILNTLYPHQKAGLQSILGDLQGVDAGGNFRGKTKRLSPSEQKLSEWGYLASYRGENGELRGDTLAWAALTYVPMGAEFKNYLDAGLASNPHAQRMLAKKDPDFATVMRGLGSFAGKWSGVVNPYPTSVPPGAVEWGQTIQSKQQEWHMKAAQKAAQDALIDVGREDKAREIWAPVGEEED